MSKIELTHIDKYYGKNHVLKDLNLTIEDGDFMTLLGPSGCGKTTTLRVVSGLEKPQNGIILMDGKEIVNAAEASFAPPSKRNLNLVFQFKDIPLLTKVISVPKQNYATTDRKAILDNVLKLLDGHERIVAITPHQRGEKFEELPVERFETHTRAFIKVEDGCNRQCAYCVIPRARGPVRSRAEESILAELHQLAAAGYREVVLSAISLPSYGLDTGTNLVELVEKCAQVPGIERIRLGSLDPDMLTPEFISRLAAVDKLCPQFHLSLQSGCTATLRRMRRVYTAQEYAQVVEQIRAAYGSRPVSFTTDCICGFPGETAEDFEESCAFLKKIGFVKVHVFPYSRRSGTPAYDFPDQIHEREKQERSRRMNAVAEQVRCEALAAFEGTEDEVLLETPLSGTLFTGYTRLYIPVVVSAPGCESGQIVRVKLGRYDGERVRAALC